MSCQPGMGHFSPLVPLGKALQRRGVRVTVATAACFESRVREHGFDFLAAGLDFDESDLESSFPELFDQPEDRRARWLLENVFLDAGPRRMFDDLLPRMEEFDLVVHNHYELGAQMAAEARGLPYVGVNVSFVVNREVMKIIQGRQMRRLRRRCGLEDDRQLGYIGRHLDIRLMPPGFTFLNAMSSPRFRSSLRAKLLALRGRQSPRALRMLLVSAVLGVVKRRVGGLPPSEKERFVDNRPERAEPRVLPHWLRTMPRDRPTVYVSLGSVFNSVYPKTFETILDGLRGKNLNVIVTTGPGVAADAFGEQPTNVYMKQFVPQELILPHVDLCINHGGFGSVMGALSHGVPLVVFPLSADQPIISGIIAAHGASVALPHEVERIDAEGAIGCLPRRITSAHVSRLVDEALGNPRYREAARAIAREIAALDGIDSVVEDMLALIPAAATAAARPLAA